MITIFGDFCQFSLKILALFLKNQFFDLFFAKQYIAVFCVKPLFFGENI
jgi:hypothetical protein